MHVREIIATGLANASRPLDRALTGLSEKELKWQPRSDANSIQIILFHIFRYEDMTVQSRIQGKQEIWKIDNWGAKVGREADNDHGDRYTAEQVAGFDIPNTKALMEYMTAVRKNTIEFLNNLPDAEFDRKITLPAFGPPPAPGTPPLPPREVSVGSMLLMAATHACQHGGEISYIRGLFRGMDK